VPDDDAALKLALELMAIPGPSGQEGRIVEVVRRKLRQAGVPDSAITTDNAHRRSPLRGEVGNLICKLPGTARAPRRMLMAHVDTVPLCVGCRPKREGDIVRSADPATGLGADDRAGAGVVLTAALTILRHKLPHPPLTFFWPVQEEVGLHGAQHAQLARLGQPRLAFNWDGGPAEKVTIGATGAYRMQVTIHGLASHAGVAPELGVSAITIAGVAIAALQRDGWLGSIQRGDRRGTSNIGFVEAGGATNVVTDRLELRAECRSHDREFRREVLAAFEQAFRASATSVRSATGAVGRVEFTSRLDYESFVLADGEPCVLAAEAAVRAVGGEPLRAISNGGLDANWMTAHGIPTVTMGCGQMSPHTVSERLDLAAFRRACRVALRLATAAENEPFA
jgi:tripeptide aminopeptidase